MPEPPLLTLGLTGPGDVELHRALRALAPERRHVFEPLHPRLAEYHHTLEKHPGAWPEGTDEPDRRELQTGLLNRGNPADLGYVPRFGRGGYYRSRLAEDPDLGAYLRRLVDRDGDPAHLHLNRALGRTGLLVDLFPEGRAILLVRHPLSTWATWREDPSVEDRLERRLYELRTQLPEDEHRAWGFEPARNHSARASFLLTWGFSWRLALGEARGFAELRVVRHRTLIEEPESTLDDLAAWLGADADRVTRALAALDGASAPGPPRGVDSALPEDLPETSPLGDVLASFGYRPDARGESKRGQ